MNRFLVCLLLLGMFVLTACGRTVRIPTVDELIGPVPTAIPVGEQVPTPLPNIRSVGPDELTVTAAAYLGQVAATEQAILALVPTPLPLATIVPTPEGERDSADIPTSEPTTLPPTPTVTPSPSTPLEIILRTPLDGSQFIAGTGIDVSGTAVGGVPGQLIRVALVNEQGGQVAVASLITQPNGEWRVILPVPPGATGILLVEAKGVDAAGNVLSETAVPVELVTAEVELAEIPENDYFISIDRISEQAFAGRGIFLNGRAANLLDTYDVTIEIYYQDCTVGAGTVSFQMYGSGGWNGYLIVPGGTVGQTICVRAHTGTPGTDSFREVERKLVVGDPFSAETTPSVSIAAPRPDSYWTPPFNVTGIAINPPLGYILVQISTIGGDIVWQEQVFPDGYGNWSATATFPVSQPFPVVIAAILDNNDGTFITDQHGFTVQPQPTPTPVIEEEEDS